MAQKKPPRNEPRGQFSGRLYMLKNFVRTLVNDILHLTLGEIELLSQSLKSNAVQKATFEDPPVSLVEYPFVDQLLPL